LKAAVTVLQYIKDITNSKECVMRKPRKLKDGASYHVISRANRKEMILNPDEVKEEFLQVLRRAQKKYKFVIKNFCIMGNHYHLIIKPLGKESLSKIMQWILSIFALKFNRMFGLTGHVWNDRFISKIIYNYTQYLTTFVYIANNPVRAKITKWPGDYQYNGIAFLQKGILDILERPPNEFLRHVWRKIVKKEETTDRITEKAEVTEVAKIR
jgi:REP element-mobilizing transposase RayT